MTQTKAAPIPPATPAAPGRRPRRDAPGDIKVEATKLGYYDDKRRRVGDVFSIRNMSEFSDKWMVKVDPSTPDRLTSGKEDLQRQHDEILAGRAVDRGGVTSPDGPPPIPTGSLPAIDEE